MSDRQETSEDRIIRYAGYLLYLIGIFVLIIYGYYTNKFLKYADWSRAVIFLPLVPLFILIVIRDTINFIKSLRNSSKNFKAK